MKQTVAVFISKIADEKGRYVAEASNGSSEGPPFVRIQVSAGDVRQLAMSDRLKLTVEDWPEP